MIPFVDVSIRCLRLQPPSFNSPRIARAAILSKASVLDLLKGLDVVFFFFFLSSFNKSFAIATRLCVLLPFAVFCLIIWKILNLYLWFGPVHPLPRRRLTLGLSAPGPVDCPGNELILSVFSSCHLLVTSSALYLQMKEIYPQQVKAVTTWLTLSSVAANAPAYMSPQTLLSWNHQPNTNPTLATLFCV